MSAPLVSVVIPCYNGSKFLRRTITSVLRNPYRPIEILVVDDGSNDDSRAVAEKMAERFSEIRVLAKENGGVSSARNHGIREARADYIALLDADDLFYPDTMEKRMQVFREEDDPEMLGVFCPAVLVDEKGNPLIERTMFSPALPNDRFYYSASPHCVSIPSSFILKKAKMMERGLFDETVCPAEDFEYWHRLLRRGGYFRMVRTCVVGWVQHKNSATHNQILHHQKRVKTVIKRMFEPDPASTIPEYRQSYGDMIYHQTLSANAFNSAMMAAVSGHPDVAMEITRDVSWFYLEKQEARFYEMEARLTAGRSLCLPESAWVSQIWPAVRDRVRDYFAFLEKHFKREIPLLEEALTALEMEETKPVLKSK
jgi:glycosyltransferase involved in cell wall biosynthesis